MKKLSPISIKPASLRAIALQRLCTALVGYVDNFVHKFKVTPQTSSKEQEISPDALCYNTT